MVPPVSRELPPFVSDGSFGATCRTLYSFLKGLFIVTYYSTSDLFSKGPLLSPSLSLVLSLTPN